MLSLRTVATAFYAVLAVGALSGCADKPPADDPDAVAEYNEANDPIEPFNRTMYSVNETLDDYVLHPAALHYRENVPAYVRERIRDFLHNLGSPVTFSNDVLQADPHRAAVTLFRFLINTSAGVGGFYDIAPAPRHDADLGQTFGIWGVGEGPYLLLPLFGPSNPRDALGVGVESYFDPLDRWATNMGYDWTVYTRAVISGIDRREAALDQIDEIKRTSVDPYVAMRSLYRQYRRAQIAGTSGQRKHGSYADDLSDIVSEIYFHPK